jgi:hypothetical protein
MLACADTDAANIEADADENVGLRAATIDERLGSLVISGSVERAVLRAAREERALDAAAGLEGKKVLLARMEDRTEVMAADARAGSGCGLGPPRPELMRSPIFTEG